MGHKHCILGIEPYVCLNKHSSSQEPTCYLYTITIFHYTEHMVHICLCLLQSADLTGGLHVQILLITFYLISYTFYLFV